MFNAIRAYTEHLAEVGLTDTNAVAQALHSAVLDNHNRDFTVIIPQKAALMEAEFYNGSTEYVKGEDK